MSEIRTGDMHIHMIGTDHTLAPLEVRSAFSLSAESRDAALPDARVNLDASGIALLSTCNRVELWASFAGDALPPEPDVEGQMAKLLAKALCNAYGLDASEYGAYFTVRSGREAVAHLFEVASGLRSAIVAEDQIVSQVKQAIALARDLGVADSCLEVLFREAVTAAKKVKSRIHFMRAHATAIGRAIDLLAGEGVDLHECTCMVIGNGEYGRLAATTLQQAGARVIMTVRQYSHGAVVLPDGCEGVAYDQRYRHLPACQVVMSATTSPHYTLEFQEFSQACSKNVPGHLFDLAIPQDIDPVIRGWKGVKLFDIDDFKTDVEQENEQAVAAAHRIIDEGMAEFWDWMRRREQCASDRPATQMFFPLFMDMSEKKAVFVGGGAVALRRVRTLLQFVGDIVVYAPEFSPELVRFASDGVISLVRRSYDPSVLDGADMVFACTNDADLNNSVWEECKRRGVLVNVCSDRFKCDFHFPGVVVQDNVVVGVNAGGKDHRRVKQLRAHIQTMMEQEDV